MNALLSRSILALVLIGCGHSRQALPRPRQPFTATPDAPFRRSAPAPLALEATPFRAPQVERRELANGMRVYVLYRPDSKVVALSYGNGAAPIYEAGVPHGLAVLVGDAMLQGTRLTDGGDIMTGLHVGGITPQVATGPYGTTVELQVLASGFAQALLAVARIVRAPAFEPAGIEVARRQQLNVLYDEGEGLRDLVGPLAVKAAFGEAQPMPNSPRETAADLLELSADDVRRYYARVYTPGNSVLVVAGPVTLSQVSAEIEKQFGSWSPQAGQRTPARERASAEPIRRRKIYALGNGGDESTVYVIQPGLAPDDPDRMARALLVEVLTGAAASRLPQVLRHESALTYSVGSQFLKAPAGELALITTRVNNRRLGRTVRLIRGELTRLMETGVSERELAAAKSSLRASMRLQSTASMASAFVFHAMIGMRDGWYEDQLHAIDSATVSDLRRVAQRCLRPNDFQIVVTGNQREIGRQLRWWSPIEYFGWD